MIKNIVFDIGGVLAEYRLKEFLAEKGFDGTMIKRVIRASIMSPYWESFERGEMTEEETMEKFIGLDPEIEKELRIAYTSVEGMLVSQSFAVPWVKSLKEAGLSVYCLSNYSRKAFNECGESLAFMESIDGALLSFQAGRTKPDPEMYRMFLEKFSLKAEECVFVDDTPENVNVAESMGFRGIVFTSYEDASEKMSGILGWH